MDFFGSRSFPQASSMEKSLPVEIIFEILSRLPVESLLRCRSVCKLWCSSISDPYFVKSHLSLSTSSNSNYAHQKLVYSYGPVIKTCHVYDMLCDNLVNASELDDYPFKNPRKFVSIIGSCNGLLCVCIENQTLFIWNPSTRKSNSLPYNGHKTWHNQYVVYGGFGYEESTDDYKVVALCFTLKDSSRYETCVSIYSLKTGKWKEIGGFPSGLVPTCFPGKFSNGALHWFVCKGLKSSDLRTIISLDLAKETCGEVSQPLYDEGGYKYLMLGALREWLCVSCNYNGFHGDLWIMKVYGVKDSWTKLLSISYAGVPGRLRTLVPLWMINDGKILLQLGFELIVYDSKNRSYSEIPNVEKCPIVCIYVESLVSPDAPNKSK